MNVVGHLLRPQPTPDRSSVGRPARYALLSVFCGAVAQGGLAIAYGLFGWTPTASVLFSLAVSVAPSYWGSRTYVWADLSRLGRRSETILFFLIAAAGSASAIVLTRGAQALGAIFTHDRALLTVWVSAGSTTATVVVWVTRYVVLDKFLFQPIQRFTRLAEDPAAV